MKGSHHLCSHLVRLDAGGRQQWVNLEEIWEDGAMLECEEEIEIGAPAAISADDVTFRGRIIAVSPHDFGWSAEMVFSPSTLWSMERWRPEHAIDPQEIPKVL